MKASKINKTQENIIDAIGEGAFRDAMFFFEFAKSRGKLSFYQHNYDGKSHDIREQIGENTERLIASFVSDIMMALDLDGVLVGKQRPFLMDMVKEHEEAKSKCPAYLKWKEQHGK